MKRVRIHSQGNEINGGRCEKYIRYLSGEDLVGEAAAQHVLNVGHPAGGLQPAVRTLEYLL